MSISPNRVKPRVNPATWTQQQMTRAKQVDYERKVAQYKDDVADILALDNSEGLRMPSIAPGQASIGVPGYQPKLVEKVIRSGDQDPRLGSVDVPGFGSFKETEDGFQVTREFSSSENNGTIGPFGGRQATKASGTKLRRTYEVNKNGTIAVFSEENDWTANLQESERTNTRKTESYILNSNSATVDGYLIDSQTKTSNYK